MRSAGPLKLNGPIICNGVKTMEDKDIERELLIKYTREIYISCISTAYANPDFSPDPEAYLGYAEEAAQALIDWQKKIMKNEKEN
jgi:hypothetical protein